MTHFKPYPIEFIERNLAMAFKDLLYGNTSTKEFAYDFLFDLKQELLDDEQYEKLAQLAHLEQIYGYTLPHLTVMP